MNTSEKIAALTALGWTQTAISEKTGIPQGTISRIASAEHKDPRASNAYAIDKLYEQVMSEHKDAA